MNTKKFKVVPGYIVEYSYSNHVCISKEEFNRYYGAMNLYGEASEEQVMTAVLNLSANPEEDEDQITNIFDEASLFRIWICNPKKTPVAKVANFFTAAKLGLLSKRDAQYADESFLLLLLRNSDYVAVEFKDGRQVVLTAADLGSLV